MSSSECYSALGIPIGATEDAIKQAYRNLAKVHHPDLGGSTEKFVTIQKAYENLMDPMFRKTDFSSTNSSWDTASSGRYWKAWETDNTWWSSSSKSSTYSADQDFDEDFENQWRKFTAGKKKTQRFKAKKQFYDFDDPEDDRVESTKTSIRRGRKSRTNDPLILPGKVIFSADTKSSRAVCILGEYMRVSKFNGRVSYTNKHLKLFLFWSNKNKDWKISSALKDDENCIAFNDRCHPAVDSPFVVGEASTWMVWNERAKRYFPACIQVGAVDFNDWSVAWTIFVYELINCRFEHQRQWSIDTTKFNSWQDLAKIQDRYNSNLTLTND